jgi:uncharacterized protein (TIGR02271 family)
MTNEASDRPAADKVAGSDVVLPLMEEQAHLEIRQVATGRVRVGITSEAFEQIAEATLEGDEVEVVRVPVDQVVTSAPAIRTEGGVTIIPVLEEVLVVEKQLVLKEELHVRRRITTEQVAVPVTLRRQRAVVERTDKPS